MKKIICAAVMVAFLLSSTAVFADGRGRGGGGGHGGGVSTGGAVAIGVGALFLGAIIGSEAQKQAQQAPVQYVPVAPPQYAPAPMPVQVQPPVFMRGTCFPQGGYFPNGVMISGLGYFPPGTAVPPGYCFQ